MAVLGVKLMEINNNLFSRYTIHIMGIHVVWVSVRPCRNLQFVPFRPILPKKLHEVCFAGLETFVSSAPKNCGIS